MIFVRELCLTVDKKTMFSADEIIRFIRVLNLKPAKIYAYNLFRNKTIKYEESKLYELDTLEKKEGDIHIQFDLETEEGKCRLYIGDCHNDAYRLSAYAPIQCINDLTDMLDELFSNYDEYLFAYIEDENYDEDILLGDDDVDWKKNKFKNVKLEYIVRLTENSHIFVVNHKTAKKYQKLHEQCIYEIELYNECLPGHWHNSDDATFGCAWMMWYGTYYKKYLDFDELRKFDNCSSNVELKNGAIRIKMYDDIRMYDTKENVARVWDFRKKLKIDEVAHEIEGLFYPKLEVDENKIIDPGDKYY